MLVEFLNVIEPVDNLFETAIVFFWFVVGVIAVEVDELFVVKG